MPCPFNACGDTLVRSLPNFFDPGRIEGITNPSFAESIKKWRFSVGFSHNMLIKCVFIKIVYNTQKFQSFILTSIGDRCTLTHKRTFCFDIVIDRNLQCLNMLGMRERDTVGGAPEQGECPSYPELSTRWKLVLL